MGITLLLITVLLCVLTAWYFKLKWKLSYWTRKGIFQLEPVLFYGNAKEMFKGDKSLAELILHLYRKVKDSGHKCGGFYMMASKIFVPVDPELIKDIMHKNYDYFDGHFPDFPNKTIFDRGIFHMQGEPWRKTRKSLTPTFTSGKMKMMFDTLLEKTVGLGELAVEIAESGEPANIKEILGRFTTDVIGSVGFGIECNSLKNPDADFLKHGKTIVEPPPQGSFLLRFAKNMILGPKKPKDISETENFFKNIVTETIEFREKNKMYRKDFMHLMIQLKNKGVVTATDDVDVFHKSDKALNGNTMSVDEITAQVILFFIAGFETSATTMTFALLELAKNQEIQDKVRKEANDILKKYNGKFTYEAMMELTYTERVIYETLRKYPPLATIPRVCTKDYLIPGTNIVIEKDTNTSIPVWGLHMDPDYFPDPEKFDPDRFSEANKGNIREYTYIPFGEGPRMCLGLRFGMMQSKTGLFSLVKNYKFTLHKNTTFPLKMQKESFILSVEGDVWLNIEKVDS